ncbi:MAG: UDP-N-acetylmuramoyl-tripeptide--D-alanyl-D-alanine ligase [Gammaproteobacteria bacterium]|nr:UDP-N-acetylmuramoyl-tripeptide--D-alanyl-D-alanine ligase [Gammaproteobacteria bacterium]
MIGTLATAAVSMQGVLQGNDRPFAGLSTDTRTLREGELFFALQGPNFDGHDYVATAEKNGAAGAVVSHVVDETLSQVTVDDTRIALGSLAAAWRSQQQAAVIGITGSNGKTTVKELVKACLAEKAPTLATSGNLNNDIGMPLMMARIEDGHRFAVLEMGANHAGEIAYLTSLARPDVVLITNAAAAHLEGFGSIDGVSKAKGEILTNPQRPATAILNADDRYFDYWSSLVEDIRMISFGLGADADVRADNIETRPQASRFDLHLPDATIDIGLPLSGIHNVRNACAAAAVAHALDVDAQRIKKGLERVAPVGGRLQTLRGINGATLFDDSYNANPLSVITAAEFLAQLPGKNWLVLGDMKELGEDAAKLHREVGEAARARGIDRVFALGQLSRDLVDGFGESATWYDSEDALIDDLGAALAPDVNVLVKGSRSMHMERIVDAIRDNGAAGRGS